MMGSRLLIWFPSDKSMRPYSIVPLQNIHQRRRVALSRPQRPSAGLWKIRLRDFKPFLCDSFMFDSSTAAEFYNVVYKKRYDLALNNGIMENARGSSGIMKKTKKLMKKKSLSRTSGSMFRVNTVPMRNIATKTRSVKRFSKHGTGMNAITIWKNTINQLCWNIAPRLIAPWTRFAIPSIPSTPADVRRTCCGAATSVKPTAVYPVDRGTRPVKGAADIAYGRNFHDNVDTERASALFTPGNGAGAAGGTYAESAGSARIAGRAAWKKRAKSFGAAHASGCMAPREAC